MYTNGYVIQSKAATQYCGSSFTYIHASWVYTRQNPHRIEICFSFVSLSDMGVVLRLSRLQQAVTNHIAQVTLPG